MDYGLRTNSYSQDFFLSPTVGLDPSPELNRTGVDLVFDLSQNNDGVTAIQQALAAGSVSLGFRDIVVMKEGSRPVCLDATSDVEIIVGNKPVPVDEGFREKEKSARGTMVGMIAIYLIVGIIILVLTFVKSLSQKQQRLEYHKNEKQKEIYDGLLSNLRNDRQVIIAEAREKRSEVKRETRQRSRQQ